MNSKKATFAPYTSPFTSGIARDDSAMDWSADTPTPSSSAPTPRVSPAGEHMSSPHVQDCSNGSNISERPDTASRVLDYENLQPIHPKLWDGSHSATSLFGIEGTRPIDVENLILSIKRINVFLRCNPVEKKIAPEGFDGVAEQLLLLIQAIFNSRWSDANLQTKKGKTNIMKFLEGIFIPNKKTKESNELLPISESATENPNVPSPVVPLPTTTSPSVPLLPSLLVTKQVDIIKKKTLAQYNVKKLYVMASKANISSKVENIL